MKNLLLLTITLPILFTAQAQSWQWGKRGGSPDNNANQLLEQVQDMVTDNAGNLYIIANVATPTPMTFTDVAGTTAGYGDMDILIASYSCSGTMRWKKIIGGGGQDGYVVGGNNLSIGVDTLGHVYASGYVVPTSIRARFDADTTLTSSNNKWNFIVQYDTAGNFKWLRMPTPDTVAGLRQNQYILYDMVVNKNGIADVLCYFSKSGPIGNSNGAFSADTSHAYVLSYNSNGDVVKLVKPEMSIRIGQDTFTSFGTIRIGRMPSGNYVVSGGLYFDPSADPGKFPFYAGNQLINHSMFVACFDSNWHFLWQRQSMDYQSIFYHRPVFDAQNNIYVAGSSVVGQGNSFNGYSFTNSIGTVNRVLPTIAKLNANGNNVWIRNASMVFNTFSPSVALTPNGKVYLTYSYKGRVLWDASHYYDDYDASFSKGYNIAMTCFDAQTGNILSMDSLVSTTNSGEYVVAATTDSKNNVYLGGYLEGNMVIGNTGTTLTKYGGSSDFFVVKYGSSDCSSTTVPLRIMSYELRIKNGKVVNYWVTANEENVSHHNIQRSADGIEFTNVGKVAANNKTYNEYSFTDKQPLNGKSYYRIESVDKDGSVSYSVVREVQLIGNEQLKIYPNPATNRINISYNAGSSLKDTEIELCDMQGRMLRYYKLNEQRGNFTASTGGLAAGMYIVRLKQNGAVVKTEKLIISGR